MSELIWDEWNYCSGCGAQMIEATSHKFNRRTGEKMLEKRCPKWSYGNSHLHDRLDAREPFEHGSMDESE